MNIIRDLNKEKMKAIERSQGGIYQATSGKPGFQFMPSSTLQKKQTSSNKGKKVNVKTSAIQLLTK